ncbi:hypothetical protein ZWY2020_046652 [Hordeum vulgare]|nr:hypothetical protein ZWY2020_046652 [Hordeum vulgare]
MGNLTYERAGAYLRLEERRLKHLRSGAVHTAFAPGFLRGGSFLRPLAPMGSRSSHLGLRPLLPRLAFMAPPLAVAANSRHTSSSATTAATPGAVPPW